MKLTTVEEMRNIDKRAIEEVGIPEIVLMENASREIAKAMEEILKGVAGKRICVVAGTGNNGGDAFAAARHLANAGARVKVFVLGKPEKMSQSAATNFNVICNMGIEVFHLSSDRDWDKLLVVLNTSQGILDGILGTGFHGELRPEAQRLIEAVNKSELPVVAIDVPSGVNAANGEVKTVAIGASVTVTLGAPKWGMMFAPGSLYCGQLLCDGIGIPAGILEDKRILQEMLTKKVAKTGMLPRPIDCHKGTCGRILVVAGSKGMTGAASLASLSALKSGAGIVTLACADSLNDIFEIKLTEVMTSPQEDDGKGYLTSANSEAILQMASKYDAVLIGPGLGRNEETMKLVRDLAAKLENKLVIDADGIYAFNRQGQLLANCSQAPVLTPHLGEMAALLGISVEELKSDLLSFTRKAAADYNAIFVVKSESTIVVYPNGMAYVSSTGNAGMATAGCGDVLAGIIAGLMQQTAENMAPLTGVYVHGLAGDICFEKKGNCLMARDIVRKIPNAMKKIM
ncbi:MAG: NAD(P)H-hydrate dehydratase [Anaerovibrio sp.]|nr:NAD(P)H-hydrate dehydratase [Anaerovibrio sp.]